MALPELIANSPTPGSRSPLATLATPLADAVTTLTTSAAAPAALQGAGQFRIVVEAEIMLVTAGAGGTSWTVTRAVESSVATSHGLGAKIWHFPTAGALDARYARVGTDGTIGGPGGTALPPSVVTGSRSSVYNAIQDGGITPNVLVDQAPAINAWLLSLPRGSVAWFPAVPDAANGNLTRYFVQSAVELAIDVAIMFPQNGRVNFSAMAGFTDTQLVRNWHGSDGTGFNPPNTTTYKAPYPCLENVGFDLNGQSNITCLGLVNTGEKAKLQHLVFVSNALNPTLAGSGTGIFGLALFANQEGNPGGDVIHDHLIFYGTGWTNVLYGDGTNNGTTTTWMRHIRFTNLNLPAQPASTNVCSDSPIKITGCDGLYLQGLIETKPQPVTSDTARIRLIDCSRVKIEMRFSQGSEAEQRPLVRATSTGTAPAQYPIGPPTIVNSNVYRGGASTAYAAAVRTDAGCGLTSGNTTITDASITANDQYRPVFGPGIPFGATIASVTPGVSFVLSSAPIITATVSLVIGANVIEDETLAAQGIRRHFQWNATYFDPLEIVLYTGGECRWLQGPLSSPTHKSAKSLRADARQAQYAPSNAISESWETGRGSPGANSGAAGLTSGTLYMQAMWLYPGDKVTNLTWYSGATPLASGTHQWSALFDASLNLKGISADATSAAWSAAAPKAFALSAAYTATLPSVHYAGLVVVASTPPNLEVSGNPVIGGVAPVLTGISTAGLTDPTSCPATAAGLASTNGVPYVLAT